MCLRIVGILLAVANVDNGSWVVLRGRRRFLAGDVVFAFDAGNGVILSAFTISRARLILCVSHALIVPYCTYLIVLDLLIDMTLTAADSLLVLVGLDLPGASLLVIRFLGLATASMLLPPRICHSFKKDVNFSWVRLESLQDWPE